MRKEKQTQAQRIGRLEKVVAQLYMMNHMVQGELKKIQDELKKPEEIINP